MTGSETAIVEFDKVSVLQRTMDYFMLGKPRVVIMVMAVTAVGFYMGTLGTPDWLRLLHVLLGTALAAGGTLTLNAYLEREQDALMQRTQARPLPDGRVEPLVALGLGSIATFGGIGYLLVVVHPLSAIVTAATTVSYLFGYTPLKRKTSLCSLVGALPGALPPVTGWVAARGAFGTEVWVLFAMLFLWQVPHSLAIAWLYREDYERAGFRLLPVEQPDGVSTGHQVVMNCLALVAVGLLPTLVGLTGVVYFGVTLLLGLVFLGFGLDLARSLSIAAARRLLYVSLIYLPLVFLFMALDKVA